MEIIFGRENAEMLRKKYTVLSLETVDAGGTPLEVFCLVTAEKLGLGELPELEQYVKLHEDFLVGYKKQEYAYCRDCIGHLMGKFGGELDSFYEEIISRFDVLDV